MHFQQQNYRHKFYCSMRHKYFRFQLILWVDWILHRADCLWWPLIKCSLAVSRAIAYHTKSNRSMVGILEFSLCVVSRDWFGSTFAILSINVFMLFQFVCRNDVILFCLLSIDSPLWMALIMMSGQGVANSIKIKWAQHRNHCIACT